MENNDNEMENANTVQTPNKSKFQSDESYALRNTLSTLNHSDNKCGYIFHFGDSGNSRSLPFIKRGTKRKSGLIHYSECKIRRVDSKYAIGSTCSPRTSPKSGCPLPFYFDDIETTRSLFIINRGFKRKGCSIYYGERKMRRVESEYFRLDLHRLFENRVCVRTIRRGTKRRGCIIYHGNRKMRRVESECFHIRHYKNMSIVRRGIKRKGCFIYYGERKMRRLEYVQPRKERRYRFRILRGYLERIKSDTSWKSKRSMKIWKNVSAPNLLIRSVQNNRYNKRRKLRAKRRCNINHDICKISNTKPKTSES